MSLRIRLSQVVVVDLSKDPDLREEILGVANANADEEDEVAYFSDLDPAEVHDALRTILEDDINAFDLFDDASLEVEVIGGAE